MRISHLSINDSTDLFLIVIAAEIVTAVEKSSVHEKKDFTCNHQCMMLNTLETEANKQNANKCGFKWSVGFILICRWMGFDGHVHVNKVIAEC